MNPKNMDSESYVIYLWRRSTAEKVPVSRREANFLALKLSREGREGFTKSNDYTLYVNVTGYPNLKVHRFADKSAIVEQSREQEGGRTAGIRHIAELEAALMSGDKKRAGFYCREIMRDLEN